MPRSHWEESEFDGMITKTKVAHLINVQPAKICTDNKQPTVTAPRLLTPNQAIGYKVDNPNFLQYSGFGLYVDKLGRNYGNNTRSKPIIKLKAQYTSADKRKINDVELNVPEPTLTSFTNLVLARLIEQNFEKSYNVGDGR